MFKTIQRGITAKCVANQQGVSTSLRVISTQRSFMQQEQSIAKLLSNVIEPITNTPLSALGGIQTISVGQNGAVKIRLDLMVAGYPHLDKVLASCRSALKGLAWVSDVQISFAPARKYSNMASSSESNALAGVGHVIAVSSCKGGVGKSTVAANLALVLSNRGLKVGLLDADVYGPSLPYLIPARSSAVRRSTANAKHVLPLEAAHGTNTHTPLKMLSFGHVNPKSGAPGSGGKSAAVVRGPIVSKIITQLLLSTEWGDLDYLLVDMPPGTGDIQITLAQSMSLTGAVIVTTPHALALVDAAKGVAMFESLKVPTLAVVENMAHFTCEHGTRYFPFGRGGRERLLRGLSNEHEPDTLARLHRCPIQSLPLVMEPEEGQPLSRQDLKAPLSSDAKSPRAVVTEQHRCSDGCSHDSVEGNREGAEALAPIVVRDPLSESARVYSALADDVLTEVFRAQTDAVLTPSVSYNSTKRVLLLRYFTATSATELSVPVEELRVRDPQCGAVLPGQDKLQYTGVSPVTLDFKGRYGVSVVWSDGHFADIFPFHVLRRIAEELSSGKQQ